MLRRLVVVAGLLIGGVCLVGKPASAACSGFTPQLFAGAWNGSAYIASFGVRASITKNPVTDIDACGTSGGAVRYFVATAQENITSNSYIEYGYEIWKDAPNHFYLAVFREAYVGGSLADFSRINPPCNTLNGAAMRFMAENLSGTTWYGGYNCTNTETPMLFSKNVNFPGGFIGYSLTESERFATASGVGATYQRLSLWTLSNVLTLWPVAMRAWGDTDADYYIDASNAFTWFTRRGSNPPGYLCTNPYGVPACF